MRYLLTTLPVLLSVALLISCDNRQQIAVGQTAWDRVELISEAAEPITEIAVREGDQLIAGSVILRQQSMLFDTRLAQANAAHAQAAARLAELQRGPRRELIEQARSRLAGGRSRLQNSDHQLQRIRELVSAKLAAEAEFDRATAERDSAAAEVDTLEAALESLLQGTTLEELQQAEAAEQQARARVRELQILTERLTVTAPQPGIVDSLPFEIGERPAPGTVVAVMLAGETPYARIYLPEPFRARVYPGRVLSIKVDGLKTRLKGRVRYVSSDPAFTPFFALTEHDRSRISYLAEVDILDTLNMPLAAGLPVQVDLSELDHE